MRKELVFGGMVVTLLVASCAGPADEITTLKKARLQTGKETANVATMVEQVVGVRGKISWSASPYGQAKGLRRLTAVADVPQIGSGGTDVLKLCFIVNTERDSLEAELESIAINGKAYRAPFEATMGLMAWKLETVFGQKGADKVTPDLH